jgi:hypothetical protein
MYQGLLSTVCRSIKRAAMQTCRHFLGSITVETLIEFNSSSPAITMATLPHRDVRYYEYIVLGCGGIGSGALYWLSKRVGSSKFDSQLYPFINNQILNNNNTKSTDKLSICLIFDREIDYLLNLLPQSVNSDQ